MKEILIYIGLAALSALVLYLIVKSIVESIKREQFRKKNRETHFSGSAVKEKKGFWASLFTPKYSSRAEAIGDYGEKRVSSFLADLDCDGLGAASQAAVLYNISRGLPVAYLIVDGNLAPDVIKNANDLRKAVASKLLLWNVRRE